MNYENEINLVELCRFLVKKWIIIFTCGAIGCALALGYSLKQTKEYYKTSATILVVEEKESAAVAAMVKQEDILEFAIKSANSGKNVSEVENHLTVNTHDNEVVIEYQDENKANANTILRTIVTKSVQDINSLDDYKVQVKESAHYIGNVVIGPSKIKSVIIGVVCGAILAVLGLIALFILENKIRDKSFIEDTLRYSIIGSVDKKNTDASMLYANLIYGFPEYRIISIDGFDDCAMSTSKALLEHLIEAKKKVLYIFEEHGNEMLSPTIENDYLSVMKYDHSYASRLFVFNKLSSYLTEIKSQYDYIIIDTNKIDDEVLSTVFNAISDGTVLVLTKNRTNASSILSYKKQLDIVKANVIGVVFRDFE